MTTALPDLHQAELSPEMLDNLFADLAAAAYVLSVRVKRRATETVDPDPISLDEGHRLVSAGACAVQVRYLFEDASWCDTFLADGRGNVRLLRIRHADA